MRKEEVAAWKLKGGEVELLAIGAGAQQSKLFVLCGDRFEASRVFRAGEFSARIIRIGSGSDRSVAMATCFVGDHQWLLTKDSLALKVGMRTYVFALRGLLYGLSLPPECSDNVIRQLEDIFLSYCAYQDLVACDVSDAWNPPETEIWTLAYEKLENLAAQRSTKIAAAVSQSMPPASNGGGTTHVDVAEAKIQRAVRMSAAVKLVSHALLSGTLLLHDHLHVSYPSPAESLPSVWALSGLLDAIESDGSEMVAAAPPAGSMVEGLWWLRIEGVKRLLEMVSAYGAAARKKPRIDEAKTSAAAAARMGQRFWGGKRGRMEPHMEGVEKQWETCD